MGATVSVLGASGYTGGEVLRLVARHPGMAAVAASADTRVGSNLADVHPHLTGASSLTLLPVGEVLAAGADLVFSCLPSGALPAPMDGLAEAIVVDLSDEHRAQDDWAYGLTEYNRAAVAASTRIANPGCYPTATLIAVLPFARAGVVTGPVIVDAMSGVSGAGRKAEDRLLFATLDRSVGAYGTVAHRHVAEMERFLESFGGLSAHVSFTPHLVPIARGLVATIRAPLVVDLDDAAACAILRDAYGSEDFVEVIDGWPQTKVVAGTNRALVSARVDRRAGLLITSAAIDNLGKGAAGQAVQNANIALGLDERSGLDQMAVWP
jgi:N-acetyl-gamma-glutamyl-phosphate reductase